jgi:hypothetical protein
MRDELAVVTGNAGQKGSQAQAGSPFLQSPTAITHHSSHNNHSPKGMNAKSEDTSLGYREAPCASGLYPAHLPS